MSAPKRVKVEGDYFHGHLPEGAVYVGRAAPGLPASPWNNPYRAGHRATGPDGREVIVLSTRHAIELFRELPDVEDRRQIREELAGRDLACWCPLTDSGGQRFPCHADVLLEIANAR